MPLKDKLRKFNRKLRHIPVYDRLYQKAHVFLRGKRPSKAAIYYHTQYKQMSVVFGQVLLDAFWGRMIGCNPYAIYLQMRSDPRCAGFSYVWVCNDMNFVPTDMRNDPAVSFVTYQSLPYQDALLTSQYLIANSNLPLHFVKKPDQTYINVWHGTPIKHLGLNAEEALTPSANTQRNFLSSDYIFSNSRVMTDRTVRAYRADAVLNRVYEVGTPRIDLTLATSREDARAMLGASKSKDVMLYAPTWRGSFTDKNTDLATQIDIITDVVLLFSQTHDVFVSVHHIMATALTARDVDFRTVPPNIPINILLAGVDILVSDYSSIVIDYLSLDRPIALLCHDYDSYSAAQGLHDNLTDLPVAFCRTIQDLQTAVWNARKPSSFDSSARYQSQFLALEDGAASRRCLDTIFAQTRTGAYPPERRKRLLFYAGRFAPNGITSSFIALTHAIDHTQYEVTILVNAKSIDQDPAHARNLQKLPPECRLVMRKGEMVSTAAETQAYAGFRQTGTYKNTADRALIETVFTREARRVFGNQVYDVAINFSGYDPFSALIISHVSADKRLIYQHNDMQLEACNPDSTRHFPELPAVFSLYERYDGIVSVTAEMLAVNRTNLSQYCTDNTKFYTVPNIISGDVIMQRADVPLAQVSPQLAALAENKALYLFCCVARLSPEKNHQCLLDAFAKVYATEPNCALVLLGKGKLEASLKKQTKRLGISEKVLFLGHQDNPYPCIKACDCKVLTSRYEGQGIVLLEALTLGLRCIATDNPAIRSILQDGVGTIVPQDTDALADAMRHAAQTGKTRQPPFDAQSYAASALQQFYHSIGS